MKSPSQRLLRLMLAAILGVGLTLLLNRLGTWWLRETIFEVDSFYDGSAALLTLAIPALFGGIALGLVAREDGLNVAAATFALFCIAGFVHPFWRIPRVTFHSAHSGGMHYFLYNPLVALAFAALGAWGASQLATGKWTLKDAEPVSPQG